MFACLRLVLLVALTALVDASGNATTSSVTQLSSRPQHALAQTHQPPSSQSSPIRRLLLATLMWSAFKVVGQVVVKEGVQYFISSMDGAEEKGKECIDKGWYMCQQGCAIANCHAGAGGQCNCNRGWGWMWTGRQDGWYIGWECAKCPGPATAGATEVQASAYAILITCIVTFLRG